MHFSSDQTDVIPQDGIRYSGKILKVNGLVGKEVAYNPSPVGTDEKGRNIIAARVESSDSDWMYRINNIPGPYDPSCRFFYEEGDELYPLENAPIFSGYEDPCCTWINIDGEKHILFGGVTVDFENRQMPRILTDLFIAKSIQELDPNKIFTTLPGKDNRFCQSKSGDLVMLNRPIKGAAYPGSISYSRLTFDELSKIESLGHKVATAELLKFSITDTRLGPNALYSKIITTPEGQEKEVFQLVCHAAIAEEYINDLGEVVKHDYAVAKIHYRAFTGIIDPEKINEPTELTQIASINDFPAGELQIKGERYGDVVFPGGILNGNLYTGVGDRAIGRILLSV